MATDKLRNQMDGFMRPASDQAPTMGLYDTNTPQSVREGTPLRLFDKSRARYKMGDVVKEDKKDFDNALATYNLMKKQGMKDDSIIARIGLNMMNRIKMNKQNVTKAATGGLMGGDPRLGKIEDIGYQAYSTGGLSDYKRVQLKNMGYDVDKYGVEYFGGMKVLNDVLKVNKYAEGGEVEGDMIIAELDPKAETSLEIQMEDAIPPREDMDEDSVLDTSMLSEEEKAQLNEAVDMHPELESIIPKIVATEFTGEGEVDGPGTGTSDSVPAMLSDGEFVFTAKAVKQIGVDKLRKQMKQAEADYDDSMAVQDSQMESGQPMMAKGGLLSADKYKI
jgi:hypothetical protein